MVDDTECERKEKQDTKAVKAFSSPGLKSPVNVI